MIEGEPIIPKPNLDFKTEDEVFAKWEKVMEDKVYTILNKAGLLLEDKMNKRSQKENRATALRMTKAMEDCAFTVNGKMKKRMDQMQEKITDEIFEIQNSKHPT